MVHGDRFHQIEFDLIKRFGNECGAPLYIVRLTDGRHMIYTLAAAANATGACKADILRAIIAGKITGLKDVNGNWQVEFAERHCSDPSVAEHGGHATRQIAEADVASIEAQIEALIREVGDRLRRQRDDLDDEVGRDRARPLQRPGATQRERRPWWHRIVG